MWSFHIPKSATTEVESLHGFESQFCALALFEFDKGEVKDLQAFQTFSRKWNISAWISTFHTERGDGPEGLKELTQITRWAIRR
jgi:hypothetical protein